MDGLNWFRANTKQMEQSRFAEPVTCSICTEDITNKSKGFVAQISACSHIFHAHCLSKWVETNLATQTDPSCPMCRNAERDRLAEDKAEHETLEREVVGEALGVELNPMHPLYRDTDYLSQFASKVAMSMIVDKVLLWENRADWLALLSRRHGQSPYCAQCWVSSESTAVAPCGGCRKVSYCSKKCQKQHWKRLHKASCLVTNPTSTPSATS
jgi:hypothetical protein